MKKIIAIATIVCLRALTACSDGNDPTLQPVAETTVCLEGAIGVSTRAVIGSGYKKDLAVCFARQDETGSGVYPELSGAVGRAIVRSCSIIRSYIRLMEAISGCTVIIRLSVKRMLRQAG